MIGLLHDVQTGSWICFSTDIRKKHSFHGKIDNILYFIIIDALLNYRNFFGITSRIKSSERFQNRIFFVVGRLLVSFFVVAFPLFRPIEFLSSTSSFFSLAFVFLSFSRFCSMCLGAEGRNSFTVV